MISPKALRKVSNLLNPQYAESVNANATITKHGENLKKAYEDKSNPTFLEILVKAESPVNYHLDSGIDIRSDSECAYAFFKILRGDQGNEVLLKNCEKFFGATDGPDAYSLIVNAPKFFEILHCEFAKARHCPVSPIFIAKVKQCSSTIRANPNHKNGSLTIAAGLRDPKLMRDLIEMGKKFPKSDNGAHVNFRGFFDCIAAVCSTILLDEETLHVLLDYGSDIENVSLCGSNLLHWACASASLDKSETRMEQAKKIVQRLITIGANRKAENHLGMTPGDYAPDYLKEYLT